MRNLEIHLRNLPEPILFENARIIQDNARPHVSAFTTNFMTEKNIRLLKQPPYSPDCNLCDSYVFPRLEAIRKGNFQSRDEINLFLQNELPQFSQHRMERH